MLYVGRMPVQGTGRARKRPFSRKIRLLRASVADSYHFYTDPDPGPEKIR